MGAQTRQWQRVVVDASAASMSVETLAMAGGSIIERGDTYCRQSRAGRGFEIRVVRYAGLQERAAGSTSQQTRHGCRHASCMLQSGGRYNFRRSVRALTGTSKQGRREGIGKRRGPTAVLALCQAANVGEALLTLSREVCKLLEGYVGRGGAIGCHSEDVCNVAERRAGARY